MEIWRKQLSFRAWHRGTREADLLMGQFADAMLPTLNEAELKQFEGLLQCGDPDLYDWMTGRSAPLPEYDHRVMHLLKEFKLKL